MNIHWLPTFLLTVTVVSGDMLIVDRGLPADNLNSAAGANRSNWTLGYADSSIPNDGGGNLYYLLGDNFNVGDPFSGASVTLTGVRMWVPQVVTGFGSFNYNDPASYQLLLGSDTNLTPVSASLSISSVVYTNGESYQTLSGIYRNMLQLDFTVNTTVPAGTEVYFGLAGFTQSGAGTYIEPYPHVTDAALSGVSQDGADGYMRTYVVVSTNMSSFNSYGAGWVYDPSTSTSWEKPADINVQVYAVPEPLTGSVLLMGATLLALRRRQHGRQP